MTKTRSTARTTKSPVGVTTADTIDDSAPLRGEPFSVEHLEQHARELGARFQVGDYDDGRTADAFQKRIDENGEILRDAHRDLSIAVQNGAPLTPDVEWILDNYNIVEEHLREIHEDLPAGFYRELPKTDDARPRVQRLAREFIVHTDSGFDERTLIRYLNAFQETAELTIGETWAFPIMLRLELTENLRRLVTQTLEDRRCRAQAEEIESGAISIRDVGLDPQDLDCSAPLLMTLLELLHQQSAEPSPRLLEVERYLEEHGKRPEELVRVAHQRQAANQVSIGNAITGLRLISALDWTSFFERVNLTERLLRTDPSEIYAAMDSPTRDRYRHEIEALAKRLKIPDTIVARTTLGLCESAAQVGKPSYERHVGYFLVDRGCPELERRLDFRPNPIERVKRLAAAHPTLVYLGTIAFMTLFVASLPTWPALVAGEYGAAAIMGALFLLPASEFAVGLVNMSIASRTRPRLLPKLELKEGVPTAYRTIVVVPSMLTGRAGIDELVERLETHYLANPEPRLLFALLGDFADAPHETMPTDHDLLEYAREKIIALNKTHGGNGPGPFALYYRRRRWNASEKIWMGWERKRGKLMELNRLLRGAADTSYEAPIGNTQATTPVDGTYPIRYVITLDADTNLPPGTALRLIGTLAHPLNHPRFDAAGRMTDGYVLLQPRIGIDLAAATRSLYARIFAQSPGIDPYVTAASDAYQDFFGEGSFIGKGIFDVDALEVALQGAFPENRILSHDLIEGCYARTALTSDIELIDGFPSNYGAETRRQHRWTRGDWQIAAWLLPWVPGEHGLRRNTLNAISRWKIADNLRRSLVAPAFMLFLIAGWLRFPEHARTWSWSVALILFFPVFNVLQATLRHWPRGMAWREYRRALTERVGRTLAQSALSLMLLPHRAWSMLDAIIRTFVRLFFTQRKLLQWETAAASEQLFGKSKWGVISMMWMAPVIALTIALFLPGEARWAAAPYLLAWLVSPLIAEWISRPRSERKSILNDTELRHLRRLSRNTWSFFERFVVAEENWLPPDNFQEYPVEKIAHRISPTNEGLFLVSTLLARDQGFVSLGGCLRLWEENLNVWSGLERLHGHFYNWYETTTLKPLFPRYLSTVDSGNLAACFVTVARGAEELRETPLFDQRAWQGIVTGLEAIDEAYRRMQPRGAVMKNPPLDELVSEFDFLREFDDPARSLSAWRVRMNAIKANLPAAQAKFSNYLAAIRDDVSEFPVLARGLMELLQSSLAEFTTYFAWSDRYLALDRNAAEDGTPTPPQKLADEPGRNAWANIHRTLDATESLESLARLEVVLKPEFELLLERWNSPTGAEAGGIAIGATWLRAFTEEIRTAATAAQATLARLAKIGELLERLTREMDFAFLFNPQRRLFSIGFNVEDGQLDRSHYDMLASEARLGVYLAIAKGDVDHRAWFKMGRTLTFAAGDLALLSWGGTMFEYLMPELFYRRYQGSILTHSCRTAVARQIEYGRSKGFPWGISESAFSALASNSDYNYRSFGVPGLGLKRGLSKDYVVSPYSTFMALEVDPVAAYENLIALAEEGAFGRWGYFDALDYTAERLPAGKRNLPVRCYMAHHQGMSFLALGNLLAGEGVRRRFHAHPLARSAELLLQERVPDAAPLVQPAESQVPEITAPRVESEMVSRRLRGYSTAAPRTHLLSNGRYSVMLTNAGGGYAKFDDMLISRWRCDATRDRWGQFLYLRDRADGRVWSATYQPTRAEPDEYEVVYSIDKAEYRRRDGALETHLEVTISPENHAELRQLKITNYGDQPVEIDVTSYAETVLASANADAAHPAFMKLFVETEYSPRDGAIIAKRRPRDAKDPVRWAAHVLASGSHTIGAIEFETDREKFLGRGRTTADPAALERGVRLSGTTGAVLDPIFSLRCRVLVRPHESSTVAFVTVVGESRAEVVSLADQYRDLRGVQRGFELSWAYSQVELRHLKISPAKAHLYQRLASMLIYPDPARRAAQQTLAANRRGQSTLWRYGISGDLPILLARITKPEQIETARELLAAHQYWRSHGLAVDLVLVNDNPGSYLDELQEQLTGVIHETYHDPDRRASNVFLLRGSQLEREEEVLLESAATFVLHGVKGSLSKQLETPIAATNSQAKPESAKVRKDHESFPVTDLRDVTLPKRTLNRVREEIATIGGQLRFWNGYGGFTADGKEYRLYLDGTKRPPKPWSNVVANPRGGFIVTESGGGYTWAGNSREYKLTGWSNEPVSDEPSEWLYLLDKSNGKIDYPLFSRGSDDAAIRTVSHGHGYSRFETESDRVFVETTISLAADDPVKMIRVRLKNRSTRTRDFALTFFAEWVLGVAREQTQLHVMTSYDETVAGLVAENRYHPELPEQAVFLKILGEKTSWTADRADFLGRNSDPARPAKLTAEPFVGSPGIGCDPCGVVRADFQLEAESERTIYIVLGAGANLDEVRSFATRYANAAEIDRSIAETAARWDDTLSMIEVSTPDPTFDLLVNRWLLYQTTGCRLWARSAFYQAGGAYGFRDQLQDVMAVVYARPDAARAHLLLAASRQFVEGDVQHWWHPPQGRGTRTRFSDDYLWLPLVVAHYIAVTGDRDVLNEQVSFLTSPPLEPREHERYESPTDSGESATLYEHCLRTLRRAFRSGPHGLPLMGCGDWNDGMNKVGELGQGESVWVGWFLLVIVREFAPLMVSAGDEAELKDFEAHCRNLRDSLETQAWDGEWYLRAFFDDGTPLGSHTNDECRIDSIAQTWAVFAGARPERTRSAIEAVWNQLVLQRERLVLLFKPPFDQTPLDPGYIKGYLPGIRENGGQYTHPALWLIQALTEIDDAERAYEVFRMINPITHAATQTDAEIYQVEPYVVCADVYGVEPHVGRGGWSWYTGSAAWMYRTAIESILGLRIRGDRLSLAPKIPDAWPEFTLTVRYRSAEYRIRYVNSAAPAGEPTTTLDGHQSTVSEIIMQDDRAKHDWIIYRGKESE